MVWAVVWLWYTPSCCICWTVIIYICTNISSLAISVCLFMHLFIGICYHHFGVSKSSWFAFHVMIILHIELFIINPRLPRGRGVTHQPIFSRLLRRYLRWRAETWLDWRPFQAGHTNFSFVSQVWPLSYEVISKPPHDRKMSQLSNAVNDSLRTFHT